MSVSGILGDSWELYRGSFRRFVLTAASVFVVVDLLLAIAADASDRNRTLAFVWGVVATFGWLIGQTWLQGALVEAVADARAGRATPVAELYRRTRFAIVPLLAVGVFAALFALATGVVVGALGIFGVVIVLVPVLWALVRWALIAPVVVVERRRARDALRRTNELVRGRNALVFGVILVTLLVSFVALAAFVTVFAFLPRFLELWIGGLVAHSLVVPFMAIAWTNVYFELREVTP